MDDPVELETQTGALAPSASGLATDYRVVHAELHGKMMAFHTAFQRDIMRERQHPSEDELIELLDAEPSGQLVVLQAHIDECSLCIATIEDLRSLVTTLADRDAWDQHLRQNIPRPCWIGTYAAISHQLHDEAEEAAEIIGDIVSGPSRWWRTRALLAPRTRTYGFVRLLLAHAEETINSSPADALEATRMAVEIASELRVEAYPFDLALSARAHAWREHAYSLFFVGRFSESLEAIDRAEELFSRLPAPEFDLGRTSLIRALIYRSIDRVAEAIPLTRTAASRFLSFGDRHRYVRARMTEAAMLHHQGAVADALAVWKSLEDEPSLQADSALGMLFHNLGHAYRDLGQFETARAYLDRAIASYEEHGLDVETIRTRWVVGEMLVMSGRASEGLPILRQTWREFQNRQMDADAALVALELAEALLLLNRPEEVPAVCRALLECFTRHGMTSRAVTALSFLREAVALGRATPSMVRDVHDFIRDIARNPERAFVPSPL